MAGLNYNDLVLSNDDIGDKEITAKPRAVKTATYTWEFLSGTSFALRKKMKTKSLLMVHLPDKDQNYIKDEKTGQVYSITLDEFQKFFDCIEGRRHYTFSDDEHNSTIFNDFCKDKEIAKCICSALESKSFNMLAKHGLMNLKQWNSIMTDNPSWNTYWWGKMDEIAEHITPENIKLVKYALNCAVQSGEREDECLDRLNRSVGNSRSWRSNRYYDDDDWKTCKFTPEAIRALLMIKNHYSVDKARLWADTYFGNQYLGGLTATGLYKIFTADEYVRNNRYYNDTPAWEEQFLWEQSEAVNTAHVVQHDCDTLMEYLLCYTIECGHPDTIGVYCEALADYYKMRLQVYGDIDEKYPLNLVGRDHDRLSYRMRIKRRVYDKAGWTAAVERAKSFECTSEKWALIAPVNTDDIVDEAQQMANCVASRIDGMVKGNHVIMFLRRKDDPQTSVCTVQLKTDGTFDGDNLEGSFNFRARHNARPTDECMDVMKKFLETIAKREKNATTGKNVLFKQALECADRIEEDAHRRLTE